MCLHGSPCVHEIAAGGAKPRALVSAGLVHEKLKPHTLVAQGLINNKEAEDGGANGSRLQKNNYN